MFNRTRRRLVVLNAAVFLLILSMLSILLYAHMRQRLLHDTDEGLQRAMRHVQQERNLSKLLDAEHADADRDEQIIYLYWDKQGKPVGQSPKDALAGRVAEVIQSAGAAQTAAASKTVEVDGRKYRVLYFALSSGPVASAAAVRSYQDVQSTLRLLLLDIAGGLIAGAIVSIAGGWFLAERALVPIRRSWEKQQQFVADASHELRTPTSVIRAQSELLLQHPKRSIEEESPQIAVILRESKRMGKLVDDLLTLARTDSNQLQIQTSPIALDAIMQEAAEQFRFLAETKQVEIVTEVEEPLSLQGDESRIRQLLVILLDNALKYTPPSGRIALIGREQANTVYIGVSDTGSGIAEEDLPFVFERFYRGDKVRSRAQGGTGLGLSIAKWIVDAHEGKIRIRSEANNGTLVEAFFPRKHRSPM